MKEIYIALMQQGWSMQAIDDMDILFYFELLAYKKPVQEPKVYIDQVL